MEGPDITPLLFIHNDDTFTTTSDAVNRVGQSHVESHCLMACWERGDCLALQVVHKESGGAAQWCVLFRVGGGDGAQIKGTVNKSTSQPVTFSHELPL